jgi:hypothetical protein
MRSFLSLAFLILLASGFSFGQDDNIACPPIKVTGPEGFELPESSISIRADVDSNVTNLTYEWTVRNGKILSGQGASVVMVMTTFSDLEVEVRVNGLSPECPSTVAKIVRISPGDPVEHDQFGELKLSDEKARLDEFFIELQKNPSDRGFFRLAMTDKERLDVKTSRLQRIVKRARYRGFDLGRLVFGLTKGTRVSTTLYKWPSGVAFFPCDECLIIYGRDLK